MALRKVLISLGLLAFAAPAFAPGAAAQSSGPTYVGPHAGRNDATDVRAAGSWDFSLDGKTIQAFCVEMNKTISTTASYSLAGTASSMIPNLPRASYIAANHAAMGTPAADEHYEAAAAQVAIWSLTDGLAVDATHVPDAAVRARATELVTLSAGHENPPAFVDAKITVAVEAAPGDSTKVNVAAHLTDPADNPLGSETLMFSNGTDTVTGLTDGSGNTVVALPAPAPSATLTYSVSFTGQSGAGALVVPNAASDQILMLTQGVSVSKSASVEFTAQATTTSTTTAPTTTSTVASTTSSTLAPIVTNVTALPFTGGEDGPGAVTLAVLAGAAGAAAAGMVVIARRRRSLL